MSETLKPPKEIQNQIIVLQKTIDDTGDKIEELNERIKKAKESIEILEAVVNAIILPIALYNTMNSTDSELKNGYLENIKYSQTALDILTKQLKECELELKTLQELKKLKN